MSRFSILMLAVAFCLFTQQANAQSKTTAQPKILAEKTWTWAPSTFNYAKLNDLVFEVGMGNHPNGGGAAYAGVEIENANTVNVNVETPLPFIHMDDNSLAGFMVDYHTAGGYTKRVALAMGLFSKKRGVPGPIAWGKAQPPDEFVDLGKKKQYDLNLKNWAPDGWDGKVWFSVSLQNSGRNTKLKAKVELLGDKIEIAQKPKEEPAKKDEKETIKDKGASPHKYFTNSLGMKFVWIPSGTFMMGSPKEEIGRRGNETQHKVTLTKGFYMSAQLVTQEQWQVVMGNNPSHFKSEKNLPVENISWNDCQEFIKKLRQKDQKPYRLPTEAEWEFCCRGGTNTPFHFGTTISTEQANYNGEVVYGNGEKGVFRKKTTPVGSFLANRWGLDDMHGNLWQWCQDVYEDYPQADVTDPQGPDSGKDRVLRGGAWNSNPEHCRTAYRNGTVPGYRIHDCGFRVCFFVENPTVVAQQPKEEPGKKEDKAPGPPQVLTADYLPHHPGSVIFIDRLATEFLPDGTCEYGAEREKLVHKNDGTIVRTIVWRGTIRGNANQKPFFDVTSLKVVNIALQPVQRRDNARFVELGTPIEGQKALEWEPILKLGAKHGDTWKWENGIATLSYALTFATTSNGLPSAVVQKTGSSGGIKVSSTAHYVKGIGLVEEENVRTENGKVVLSVKDRMVIDSDYILKAIRNEDYNIVLSENEHSQLMTEFRLGLPASLADSDIPHLIKAIQASKNKHLRDFAIIALGSIGANSAAVSTILQNLQKDAKDDSRFYAKESLERISDTIGYRKHVAGTGGKLDPITQMLLKNTSDHYKDFGFKKYSFGMTRKEVNDLTTIGGLRSEPGLITTSVGRYSDGEYRTACRWLESEQGKERFFFIDGKLSGFSKRYRNDVKGLFPTIKATFGTTAPENIIAYSVLHSGTLGRATFNFNDIYYFYPKTIAGMTLVSARSPKSPADEFLEISVLDRKWFEYAFDQNMKETRRRVKWMKDIVGQAKTLIGKSQKEQEQEIRKMPNVEKVELREGVFYILAEFGRVVVETKAGEIQCEIDCSLTMNDSLPRLFDSLVLRGSAQLADEQFRSENGKMTVNLARKNTGMNEEFVYKWQTREGWEVVITHDWRVVVTIIPKRQLD